MQKALEFYQSHRLVSMGAAILFALVAAYLFMIGQAEAAQAYTDELYQCRKVTDWYYECWTKRNFNWFEERLGFRDFWFWKRV